MKRNLRGSHCTVKSFLPSLTLKQLLKILHSWGNDLFTTIYQLRVSSNTSLLSSSKFSSEATCVSSLTVLEGPTGSPRALPKSRGSTALSPSSPSLTFHFPLKALSLYYSCLSCFKLALTAFWLMTKLKDDIICTHHHHHQLPHDSPEDWYIKKECYLTSHFLTWVCEAPVRESLFPFHAYFRSNWHFCICSYFCFEYK